jgi:hypothetical protein
MKRLWVFALLLLASGISWSAPLLNFRISRPICLLTFMETAAGYPHTSVTLRDHIRTTISSEDTADLNGLIKKFSSLDLDHTYTLDQYPAQRQKPRSSAGLIKIAAVQASDMADFFDRIAGILPNEQLLVLKDVLKQAEFYYDELIFKNSKVAIEKQLAELKLYNYKTKAAFLRLKTFYGTTWPENFPFTVAIYPIPGSLGNTTATPHNNSLVMGLLTGETNYASRIGVAMHEIGHVLYEEQPLALQWKLDSAFMSNSSLSAPYAYSYIDEALATACGNGWMYEFLTGHLDNTDWYNDVYIDKYARALYPMVKGYIDNFKTIDRRFINSAITIFEQQFPDAAYEYDNIFNKVNFYTDASDNEQYRSIMNLMNRYYRVSSSHSSYPISDEQSIALAANSAGTQFFIIHTDHKKNFDALRNLFPQLVTTNETEEGIISFIDEDKRPVVIMNVKDISRVEAAFRRMAETKKISISLSSIALN